MGAFGADGVGSVWKIRGYALVVHALPGAGASQGHRKGVYAVWDTAVVCAGGAGGSTGGSGMLFCLGLVLRTLGVGAGTARG